MINRNKSSKAKVSLDIRDSVPDWAPFQPPEARPDAPNVLYVVWDDTGLAAWECFGGLIETPNIDRIASKGLRYSNFHTTALCSPSRSCFLTGRNHHLNNMAAITEAATGFRGKSGVIPPENGMLSEILLENGYSTYCVGKWHLTPETESCMAASHRTWPLGRGFERFYGFLGAETNQWFPDLVYDNHTVDQVVGAGQDYHLSKDLIDKTIQFIQDGNQVAPDKPWFTYLAFGANHAPHHVPKEWADMYKGKFDMGYERYREIALERMKMLGIMPQETQLSKINPWASPEIIIPGDVVLPWDSLSEDQMRLFNRMAEVYAGFCSYTDHQMGRLLDYLEMSGQIDNTLIVVVSDNGASGEGSPNGSVNENKFFNNWPNDLKENLKMLDKLGSPDTYNHYPTGWAWAFNSPAKMFKRYTLEGGISDPLIISFPRVMKKVVGHIRDQYHHAIDIMPTIMECLGIEAPDYIKGYPQSEIQGVSMYYTFENAKAPTTRITQYYEMTGTRAIYHEGWKAVSRHGAISNKGEFEKDEWELYHIAEDRSETNDLAQKYAEKLKFMVALWFVEAGKNHVFPLEDRSPHDILNTERPSIAKPRASYAYYPNTSEVSEAFTPNIRNKSYRIKAELSIETLEAQGVIFAQGSRFGGHALYIKDGKIHYVYNFLGIQEYHFVGSQVIKSGDFGVTVEFRKTHENPKFSANGKLKLSMDKVLLAEGDMRTQPGRFSISGEGLVVGRETADSVSSDYSPPFWFQGGSIKSVTVTPMGDDLAEQEIEARFKFSAA